MTEQEMREAEEGAVVIGHIVQISLRDRDTMPTEDVTAIFRSGVVRVFCGEEPVIIAPLFLYEDPGASEGFIDPGAFHKFVPISFGKPDEVTVTFEKAVSLSRPAIMDACLIEVGRCDVVEVVREDGDDSGATGVCNHIFSCVFVSETHC